MGQAANYTDRTLLEHNILLVSYARSGKRVEKVVVRIPCIFILRIYVMVFDCGMKDDSK